MKEIPQLKSRSNPRTRCQFLSICSCADLPICLARHRDVEDTARLRRRYRELCGKGASFQMTHSTVVLQARQAESEQSAQHALSNFCEAYWPPLYAFLRRRGHSSPDAQDYVQGFFTYLLIEGILTRADQGKGKLRTYLLTSLQYFVRDQQDRACTLKRGGGQQILSFDEFMLEAEASMMATQHLDDATTYDLTWASSIARRAGKERPRSGRQCTCARFR